MQLAKYCEAEIRKGLRRLAKKKREYAERQRMFDEVEAFFRGAGGQA